MHTHASSDQTPNPTAVAADMQKLSTDFTQYMTDRAAWYNVYSTDYAAVVADKAKLATDTTSLKTQLTTDQAAAKTALDADRAAMLNLYNTLMPTLTQDKANIKADIAANNTAQLAIDQQQFNTDHANAESQMHPLYQQLVTDQSTWKTTLFNDRQAIENGGGADRTQYQTDMAQLRADAKTWSATLKADRMTIAADEKQLRADGYYEPQGDFGGSQK